MGAAAQAGDIFWLDPRPAAPPNRGDLAAWAPTAMVGTTFLKRVIGLPGEQVWTQAGRVWIDGRPLVEPYVIGGPSSDAPQSWLLGPCEVLLFGDRRDDSLDGRRLGPVPWTELLGVVRRRLWPPRRNPRIMPVYGHPGFLQHV